MKKVIMLLGITIIFLIRMEVVAQEVYRLKGYKSIGNNGVNWQSIDLKVEILQIGSQDKVTVSGYKDTYGNWQNTTIINAGKNYSTSAKGKQFEYTVVLNGSVVYFNLGNDGITVESLNGKNNTGTNSNSNSSTSQIPIKNEWYQFAPPVSGQDAKIQAEARSENYKDIYDLQSRYRAIKNFPNSIPNGWHKVEIITGSSSSKYRSSGEAFVYDNKIENYISIGRNVSLIKNVFPVGTIQLGKGYFESIGYSEYSKQVNKDDMPTEVYFMEYLNSNNTQLGKIENAGDYSFCSLNKQISKKQDILIFLKEVTQGDNEYVFIGSISKGNFLTEKDSENLKCSNEKLFTTRQKLGVYKYLAITADGSWKWQGNITISEMKLNCDVKRLR